MPKKKVTGRPPASPHGPGTNRGLGRVADKDWKKIKSAAKLAGMTTSAWCRTVVLDAAKAATTRS